MIISVQVKFNSFENKVVKLSDLNYEVFVKALPEKGKANLEVVKLLSKYFDVSHKNVLIKNKISRKKIVVIEKS